MVKHAREHNKYSDVSLKQLNVEKMLENFYSDHEIIKLVIFFRFPMTLTIIVRECRHQN